MKGNVNKKWAVAFLQTKFSEPAITLENTVFANINTGKPVWWMTPNNKKFLQDLFIVINDNDTQLLIFFIPGNSITSPSSVFHQRKDNRSSIEIYTEIPTTPPRFTEARKKEISFDQFFFDRLPLADGA